LSKRVSLLGGPYHYPFFCTYVERGTNLRKKERRKEREKKQEGKQERKKKGREERK